MIVGIEKPKAVRISSSKWTRRSLEKDNIGKAGRVLYLGLVDQQKS